MGFNTELIKQLNLFLCDDITKIIISYKSFDETQLLYTYDMKMCYDEVYLIGEKLYFYYYDHNAYFDLVSKTIYVDIKNEPTILFNKYKTCDKIFGNLLCGNRFKLYDEKKEVINLDQVIKLKIYKNCIYYSIEHNIYCQIIDNTIKSPIIISRNRCSSKYITCLRCGDYLNFDISNNKFYILDPFEKRISMYDISDNYHLKSIKNTKTYVMYKLFARDTKFFVTSNFVFLYTKFEILVFCHNLEFFKSMLLSNDVTTRLSDGINAENYIVFMINKRVNIYELY